MRRGAAPVFLVDSREQRPWPLAGRRWRRAALRHGDYAVRGRERALAVERKSPEDFSASIADGRLFKQCGTAAGAGVRLVVVVEGSWGWVEAAMAERGRSLRLAVALLVASGWGPPLFADSRHDAERAAVAILEADHAGKTKEAPCARKRAPRSR